MNPKKVILITNSYFPEPGIQARRMKERVHFLKKNQFDVEVITPFHVEHAELYAAHTSDEEIIYRVKPLFSKAFPSFEYWKIQLPALLFFLRPFLFLLGYIRWLPVAFYTYFKISSREKSLYTFNNPITLHLFGFLPFAKKNWVAEFRDPLVGYEFSHRGRLGKIIDISLEKLLHKFTTATCFRKGIQLSQAELAQRHPKYAHKIKLLPDYGVDLRQYENFGFPDAEAPILQGVFAGDFYGDSDPSKLTAEIAKRTQKDFSLHFYGNHLKGIQSRDQIHNHGFIAYSDLLKQYEKCHFSIIYDEATSHSSLQNFFPSKLAELIALHRPILFVGNMNSITAQLIQTNQLGICTPNRTPDIGNALDALAKMIRQQTFNKRYFLENRNSVSLEYAEAEFQKLLQ